MNNEGVVIFLGLISLIITVLGWLVLVFAADVNHLKRKLAKTKEELRQAESIAYGDDD